MAMEITIETTDGRERINAAVIGPVAVHKSATIEQRSGYVLTHIASGRRIRGYSTRKLATEVAKYLVGIVANESTEVVDGWWNAAAPTREALQGMRLNMIEAERLADAWAKRRDRVLA